MTRPGTLDLLLNPRSVAIVGASDDPGRLSGMSLRFLREGGFAGDIWPVNPRRETVQGLTSYASAADLPNAPDVAIIVTPMTMVEQALQDLADRGASAAMIFAGGFTEAGEEGRHAQQRLLDIARAAKMRLLGPNIVGCYNAGTGFYGTISICLDGGFPAPGNVAMVSQSGAYGEQVAHMLGQRGLGVRYLVTTGNEVDIDVSEAISWMAEQPDIDVIVAYSEGVRDATRFVAALESARAADKQIVLAKVGRSSAGGKAVASHTGALAGDDRFWDAVCRKYGVLRAQGVEEQIDVAYAASRRLFPDGRKLGVLTVSGGFGIQFCDSAASFDLEVPPLPAATQAQLEALLPFGSISNPIDASGQIVAHLDRLGPSLDCISRKAGYDAVVAIMGSIFLGPAMKEPLLKSLIDASAGLRDKLVALCCIADPDTVRLLEQAGYLVFFDGARAARALSGLAKLSEGRGGTSRSIALPSSVEIGSRSLSEHAAKALLSGAGLDIPPERIVSTAEKAVAAARDLGFPVVMKICSPAILHKTEIGGVLLSVVDDDAVQAGFRTLIDRAKIAGYCEEDIEGVIVAPMAPKGIEAILGVKVDQTFGPAVLFGLGGIHAEIFKDTSLRLAPIDEEEASAMIAEVRAWPLLNGARGAPKADVAALAGNLAALSRFAAANADRLSTIDINPFVVWAEGEGAAALDVLIVPADGTEEGP